MSGSFFPMIARMRYINRWGLMRNTDVENIQEHSHMVAVLAHAWPSSRTAISAPRSTRARRRWRPCITTPAKF